MGLFSSSRNVVSNNLSTRPTTSPLQSLYSTGVMASYNTPQVSTGNVGIGGGSSQPPQTSIYNQPAPAPVIWNYTPQTYPSTSTNTGEKNTTPVNTSTNTVGSGGVPTTQAPAPVAPTGSETQQNTLLQGQQDYTNQGKTQAQIDYENNLATARSGIESSYKPLFDYYDQKMGFSLGMDTAEEVAASQTGKELDSLYGTQLGGLNELRTSGLSTLETLKKTPMEQAETQRGQVRSGIASNITDINRSANQAQQSFMRRLGVAGDSSAAVVGSEAINSEAMRQQGKQLGIQEELLGDINMNLGTILNGIETKKTELTNLYTTQKTQLDNWKAQQLTSVAQAARQQMAEIEQAKVNATVEQQQQLAQAEQDLKLGLQTQLKSFDDYMNQTKFALDNYALQRMTQMEDYKAQLAEAAKYQTSSATMPSYSTEKITTPAGQDLQLNYDKATGNYYDPMTGYIVDPNDPNMKYDPVTGQLTPESAGYVRLRNLREQNPASDNLGTTTLNTLANLGIK